MNVSGSQILWLEKINHPVENTTVGTYLGFANSSVRKQESSGWNTKVSGSQILWLENVNHLYGKYDGKNISRIRKSLGWKT